MESLAEQPLVGKELLDFIKANLDTPKGLLAREAGYYRVSEKNPDKISSDLPAFQDALLEAKGVKLKSGRAPRNTAFKTTVHRSGIILIGESYVTNNGLGRGDVMEIIPIDGGFQVVVVERAEGSPLPPIKPAPKAAPAPVTQDAA